MENPQFVPDDVPVANPLSSDTLSIFGMSLKKTYVYVGVAVLVLVIAYFVWKRYSKSNVEEDVEVDDDSEEVSDDELEDADEDYNDEVNDDDE